MGILEPGSGHSQHMDILRWQYRIPGKCEYAPSSACRDGASNRNSLGLFGSPSFQFFPVSGCELQFGPLHRGLVIESPDFGHSFGDPG
jgi:hypothetical protein